MGGNVGFLIIIFVVFAVISIGKATEGERRRTGIKNNGRSVPPPKPMPISVETPSYNRKSAFNQTPDYEKTVTTDNYGGDFIPKEDLSEKKESKRAKNVKTDKRLEAEKTLSEYITDIRETAETETKVNEALKRSKENEERLYGGVFDEFGASDALYLAKKDAEMNVTWL